MGLNTQDSPVDLPISFASVADNCVIDKAGRLASRKGFAEFLSDVEDSVGYSNKVETMFSFVTRTGATHVLFSGQEDTSDEHHLWSVDMTDGTVTKLSTGVVGGFGASNWAYASLGDICYLVQDGEDIHEYDGATFSVMAQQPEAFTNGLEHPNCVASGFGHLWVADTTTNKSTVQWTALVSGGDLPASPWTATGAGLINVEEFWPNGQDNVSAIYIHNNYLVIFGERSLLLYDVSEGPENLSLVDTVANIGCVARDSVVGVGGDLLFLAASGVRSLGRTLQNKSVPIGDISRNVRDDLKNKVRRSDFPIRAFYSPEEAFYLLFLPETLEGQSTTYVFDTRQPLQDGSLRTTVWPGRDLRCGVRDPSDGSVYLGELGIFEYIEGNDTNSAPTRASSKGIGVTYWTHPQTFGSPANLKFPKQADITLSGGTNLVLTVKWSFDFSDSYESYDISRTGVLGSEWGVGVWGSAIWGSTDALLSTERVNMWGQGRNIKLGFTGTVEDTQLSVQAVDLQALQGRLL